MKVINLFGGPGTGKSTGAAFIFSQLKMKGHNVELVTEYAKDLVWQGSQHRLADQLHVFSEQYHRLDRLKDKVELVITDSPLYLSLVYAKLNGFNKPGFEQLVQSCIDEFDNHDVFLKRQKPYQQIGRVQDEDEARNIDDIIKNRGIKLYFYDANITGYTKLFLDIEKPFSMNDETTGVILNDA